MFQFFFSLSAAEIPEIPPIFFYLHVRKSGASLLKKISLISLYNNKIMIYYIKLCTKILKFFVI